MERGGTARPPPRRRGMAAAVAAVTDGPLDLHQGGCSERCVSPSTEGVSPSSEGVCARDAPGGEDPARLCASAPLPPSPTHRVHLQPSPL